MASILTVAPPVGTVPAGDTIAATLPAFVVGTIADFAAGDAAAALRAALVSRRWRAGVLQEEPLWTRLRAAAFPSHPARAPCTYRGFRARARAARELAPLRRAELVEIEGCAWAADDASLDLPPTPAPEKAAGRAPSAFRAKFACPLFGQALRDTLETTAEGRPILHCAVCDKHVYTCGTRGELAKYASRHCVRFPKALFAETARSPSGDGDDAMEKPDYRSTVHVVLADSQPGAPTALALLRHLAECGSGYGFEAVSSPTTNPHVVLFQPARFSGWDVTTFNVWAMEVRPATATAPVTFVKPDGTPLGSSPGDPTKFSNCVVLSSPLHAALLSEQGKKESPIAAAMFCNTDVAAELDDLSKVATHIYQMWDSRYNMDMVDGDIEPDFSGDLDPAEEA